MLKSSSKIDFYHYKAFPGAYFSQSATEFEKKIVFSKLTIVH